MEARVLPLTSAPLLPSRYLPVNVRISRLKTKTPPAVVLRRCINKEEEVLSEGMPPEYCDDEWQARQREKTKELHRRRQEEDDEDERKIEEYREIGMRLKGYPEEDVRKARKLISNFIRAQEEKIEEERGELTELVLMVIWNRLDLAQRDTEILKQEATPAVRLLNNLLNMHDGFDDEGWLKLQGPLQPPLESDDTLLRVDFAREVDALLKEVRLQQDEAQTAQELDPESVASRLKQQDKQ